MVGAKSMTPSVTTIAALDVVAHDNPLRNIQMHAIARAFVSGSNQTDSYLAGFPKCTRTSARTAAQKIFKEQAMVDLVAAYFVGKADTEEAPLTKEGAIKIWTKMVETNALDYMADDGRTLTVKELKQLPLWTQRSIKKITIESSEEIIYDKDGEFQYDDNGNVIKELKQHIKIDLVDKQRALYDLARAEKWIESHDITLTTPISADTLIEAAMKQTKMLKGRIIEGEKLEQLHDEKDD